MALAVWGNFGPTIVRMIEARQPLHVTMRAGTVMSILGTATGRAFAAVMITRAPRARTWLGASEILPRDTRPPLLPHAQELRETPTIRVAITA